MTGKVQDLAERVAIVLDINISAVDVERYMCNDRCYKKIKRLEKLQEEEKLLKTELKKSFASTNRFKRGVPSDSSLSPSTIAPTKSARHNHDVHDQRTNKLIAKSLNFGSGIQEEGEKGPLLNIMPLDVFAIFKITGVDDSSICSSRSQHYVAGNLRGQRLQSTGL